MLRYWHNCISLKHNVTLQQLIDWVKSIEPQEVKQSVESLEIEHATA
jgi:hypothetical protein